MIPDAKERQGKILPLKFSVWQRDVPIIGKALRKNGDPFLPEASCLVYKKLYNLLNIIANFNFYGGPFCETGDKKGIGL